MTLNLSRFVLISMPGEPMGIPGTGKPMTRSRKLISLRSIGSVKPKFIGNKE